MEKEYQHITCPSEEGRKKKVKMDNQESNNNPTHHSHHHHTSRHHSQHKKDDADRFRETSLRAIRRRKMLPKILFWILTTITAMAVAAALAAYFLID